MTIEIRKHRRHAVARGPDRETAFDELDREVRANVAMLTGGLSPTSVALAAFDWAMHLAISPGTCVELAMRAWGMSGDGVAGTEGLDGSASKRHGAAIDPRFSAAEWSHWPFNLYRDIFLRTQDWWQRATTGIQGVDHHHEALVGFLARQWLDACSPGNYVSTNPAVINAAVESGGMNFVEGLRNWIEDAQAAVNHAGPNRKPEYATWRPGRDVAVTPGKVVWRNALCELIQYTPTTRKVAAEPVLIVPSWIMKYYILDLQPHNSLIRFLVDQGFTVFAISWQNPTEHARERSLDDYLHDGIFAACEQVRARFDEPMHLAGYCLGGTLLSMAAAAMSRDGRAGEIRTLTLLAALTDFTEPGELGLFIDASELAALDALMWRQGYLDGSQMAAAFQLLNARDLIWSRMMSEYLLGRRLKPNDLMAWNADTTRLPYRMHTEYLTRLFLDNDLAEGRYEVDGHPIALSDIEAPTFVVGTERDHVSPWRSVYKVHLLTHQPMTFVLTSGGHNAGIVSEPGHEGRFYRIAERVTDAPYRSRDDFFANAPLHDGSWWSVWSDWLRTYSSGERDAPKIGEGLCDAPGTYVFEP